MGLWLVRPLLSWSDWEMERRRPLIRIDWLQTSFITRIHQTLWHYRVRDVYILLQFWYVFLAWCHVHDSKALVAFLFYKFISSHTIYWDIMQTPGRNDKQWKTEAKLRQWAFVNHWFPLPFQFALWFVLVFARNKTWRSRSRWRSQHCVTSCRCMECSPLRAGICLGRFWRESYSLPDYPSIILYILKARIIKTCDLLQYIVIYVCLNQ